MKTKIIEELRKGKKITVKHPEFQFSIHAELKLEEGQAEPTITLGKIGLPKKASKGEKLLLKLVEVYCYDVLRNNLFRDVTESDEYKKILRRLNEPQRTR